MLFYNLLSQGYIYRERDREQVIQPFPKTNNEAIRSVLFTTVLVSKHSGKSYRDGRYRVTGTAQDGHSSSQRSSLV